MKRTVSALVFLLFFCTQLVYAVRVNTLYQGTIPVASQSAAERNRVLVPALSQVIVKLNGNSAILNNPALQIQLAEAASGLVEAFSYTALQDALHPYRVTLQFNPEGVNKLLRDAAVSIWGVNRPLIMAWVEYEAPGQEAAILDSAASSDLHNALQQQAEERGLALILPVMDVTDLNQVSVNDIVTMNVSVLRNATHRYDADVLLVARVFQSTQGFSTQAKLIVNTEEWSWNLAGASRTEVMQTLINKVAETLAARYAAVVSNDVQTTLTLKIMGITHQSDFTQLLSYIEHLAPVASVEVSQVSGDQAILDVTIRSTEQTFLQLIAVGKRLTAETNQPLVLTWHH